MPTRVQIQPGVPVPRRNRGKELSFAMKRKQNGAFHFSCSCLSVSLLCILVHVLQGVVFCHRGSAFLHGDATIWENVCCEIIFMTRSFSGINACLLHQLSQLCHLHRVGPTLTTVPFNNDGPCLWCQSGRRNQKKKKSSKSQVLISTIHQEKRTITEKRIQVQQLKALTHNLAGVHRIPRVLVDQVESTRRRALARTIQHLTTQIRKLIEGPWLLPFITIGNSTVALRIQYSLKWVVDKKAGPLPVLHQESRLALDPQP